MAHAPKRSAAVAPLVGRDAEREVLRDAIASAADGSGQAVVVRGEAGIGKTRLANEAVDDAVGSGFTALRAACHPLDADLSLAPVVTALRPFVDALSQRERVALVADLPDVVRLLPELEGRSPEALSDAGLERTRLLHALDGLLRKVEGPAVLFVDDVQWADPTTVQWLDLVGRTIDERPLLVLVTLREPLDDRPDIQALFTSWRRLSVMADIELGRLPPSATTELVKGLLGSRFPSDLADLVEQRGSGVPLFIETIVRDMVDREALTPTALGWAFAGPRQDLDVPPVVRDSILQRLERLDDAERELLRHLAVHGDALPHDLLVQVSGGDERVVQRQIDRLITGGYLAEELVAELRYRLGHPLIGEVSYEQMTESQRARAHWRLLRAMEERGVEPPRRLARHYVGARALVPPEEAATVLDRAADEALRAGAPRESARYWLAAADHTDRLGDVDRSADLLARAAGAALRDADVRVAEEAAERALALVEVQSDVNRMPRANLLRLRAEAEWSRGDRDATRRFIDAAYAELDGEPPSSVLADVMQIETFWLERAGDLDGLRAMVPRAEALADEMDSARIRAQARVASMGLAFWEGRVAEAWDEGRLALVSAREAGDDALLLRTYDLLAVLSTELPDHRTIRAVLEPGVALAQRIGATTTEIRGHGCLAIAAFTAADFDQAEAELAEVMALARRGGIERSVARALSVRPLVLVLRGRVEEAEQALAEAKEINDSLGDAHIDGTIDTTEGYLAIEIGDVERGLSMEDRLRAPGSLLPRRLTVLAELLAMGGRLDDGYAVVDQIESLIKGNDASLALSTRVRGHLALAAGDRDGAIAAWRDAVARLDALDARWETMRTRASVAELTGDVEELERCRAFFDELEVPRWSDRMRAALRAQGVRVAPPRPSKGSGILSERELEVARLAAEGLTNNQIAERLVISKYTAGSHLRRIYARLEVNSRAALTKRMAELGLL